MVLSPKLCDIDFDVYKKLCEYKQGMFIRKTFFVAILLDASFLFFSGVIIFRLYENKEKSYGDNLPQLKGKALVKREIKVRNLNKLIQEFK